MKKFKVIFTPYAKFKNLCEYSFEFERDNDNKFFLEQEAVVILRESGRDPNLFKKPVIKLISDPEAELKAAEKAAEKAAVEAEKERKAEEKAQAQAEKEKAQGEADNLKEELQRKKDEKETALLKWVESLNQKISKLSKGERLYIDDLPNEVYRKCVGVSCSELKDYIQICPEHYHAKYIKHSLPPVAKSYFDMGSAIHTLVLEPHLFDSSYVKQSADIKVRRGATWEQAVLEANALGQTLLTERQWSDLEYFRNKKEKNTVLTKLTRGGVAEQSIFFRDPETDWILKCRPDYRIDEFGFDLKSAESANPDIFSRAAIHYGYHIQDAFYSFVAGLDEFVFGAIESKIPFITTVPILMSEAAKKEGFVKFRTGLKKLIQSTETGIWPPYYSGIYTIELKPWGMTEDLDFIYDELMEKASE